MPRSSAGDVLVELQINYSRLKEVQNRSHCVVLHKSRGIKSKVTSSNDQCLYVVLLSRDVYLIVLLLKSNHIIYTRYFCK